MSWSPRQQAMLAAMGYTLYRQVVAGAGPVDAAVPTAGLPAEAAPAAVTAAETAGAADPLADRLLQALRRAAGGRDLAALALPPLPELRASAAAKRALWPRLRALRRS